ncbi:MAG: monovalent cation/H(+) antiporter subunit G [Mesorhizobium sp.]|nr:monovalent cation/H(+) antiporter subunit G [Mesorhizobium sp.]
MTLADVLTILSVSVGLIFFLAGSVGLLRFPDFHTRLHALTKADNLGLGLIAVGVAFQIADPFGIIKLALVWLLAVLAAASVAQLIARSALARLPDDGDTEQNG